MGLVASQNALIATIAGGGSSLEDIILATPGLLAYYRFEDLFGGLPPYLTSDSSGNGYHWTANLVDTFEPATSLVPGVLDDAISLVFTGGGDPPTGYAEFPTPVVDAIPFQGASFSFEFWHKYRVSGAFSGAGFYLWDTDPLAASQTPFRMDVFPAGGAAGELTQIVVDCDAGASGLNFPFQLPYPFRGDTDWHHMAFTYEGGVESRVYRDGALFFTGTAPFLSRLCTTDPPTGIFTYSIDLLLDEMAYYEAVLTPAQILARFNAV